LKKKVPNQTSRVHWQMGQALLPEHFFAQEESLREEMNLRLSMTAPPAWGLASLQWDGFQLLRGILAIQEMTLVLQSGTLIDVPGNTAPTFLNLNSTGSSRTPVYVHLQSGFDKVSTSRGQLADEGIERVVQKIELSTAPYSETSAQPPFKLAELEASAEGSWSLRPEYLPPMVALGTSPFFDHYLERMDAVARTLRQVLSDEIKNNYLAAESQAGAREFLRELYGFQAFLNDVKGRVYLHPYDVFRALRELYIDVCIYRGVEPKEIETPYDHEDLAGGFSRLLAQMEDRGQVERKADVPYVEFLRKDGLLVCELAKDLRRATDVFLLVQRPQVGGNLDLARTKLAAESRIHIVYERALRGIPFKRLDSPPFSHGLSSSVEFFAISPGQEWDYAVREGKVVLFDSRELQGARLYLYWRAE
jgi:type VI secretion system protein ImpJ